MQCPAIRSSASAFTSSIGCGWRPARQTPAVRPDAVRGEAEDIADRPLGPRLPNRRAYARQYFDFLGYVLAFDPDALLAERQSVRSRLGYDERPLIICSVGGTAVGADLLTRCGQAFPHITKQVPDAHMVLVCGPRINPATIEAPTGVEVRGYVPRLFERFAACDAAGFRRAGRSAAPATCLD